MALAVRQKYLHCISSNAQRLFAAQTWRIKGESGTDEEAVAGQGLLVRFMRLSLPQARWEDLKSSIRVTKM
jgi:hypothetical protein